MGARREEIRWVDRPGERLAGDPMESGTADLFQTQGQRVRVVFRTIMSVIARGGFFLAAEKAFEFFLRYIRLFDFDAFCLQLGPERIHF